MVERILSRVDRPAVAVTAVGVPFLTSHTKIRAHRSSLRSTDRRPTTLGGKVSLGVDSGSAQTSSELACGGLVDIQDRPERPEATTYMESRQRAWIQPIGLSMPDREKGVSMSGTAST